jgi:predicted RNA polymerase sigma factor
MQQQDREATESDFSLQNIEDSQLQMMFAICHPSIAGEAQAGLSLRILCGFGIDEIAEAFFTDKETINKQLYRVRKKLRNDGIELKLLPEKELAERLNNVLHIIYPLFNEGYYSRTENINLRKDLCPEAMRLGLLLAEYKETDSQKPMC